MRPIEFCYGRRAYRWYVTEQVVNGVRRGAAHAPHPCAPVSSSVPQVRQVDCIVGSSLRALDTKVREALTRWCLGLAAFESSVPLAEPFHRLVELLDREIAVRDDTELAIKLAVDAAIFIAPGDLAKLTCDEFDGLGQFGSLRLSNGVLWRQLDLERSHAGGMFADCRRYIDNLCLKIHLLTRDGRYRHRHLVRLGRRGEGARICERGAWGMRRGAEGV